jgi:3-carboxy-cis,cis-muconate cycloisomerase
VRLFSLRSERSAGLFDGVLARGDVPAAVSDTAWLGALLEVEAALARAEAAAGVIPEPAALAIIRTCQTITVDIADLSARAAASGSLVVPLVQRLRESVEPDAAQFVHKGATSQDIIDTATMMLARRALDALLADLDGAADTTQRLARQYRDTPMAARSLLQQALPTTFGLKAAGWMVALDECRSRLATVRSQRLAVQFGGGAGTLAGLDGAGPDVLRRLAEDLGLAEPILPWHTDRTRTAELATALGEAAGVLGKIARDVTLLAQNEVGEVSEGAPGGSSAMAHKQNPIAAVSALAGARQAPGLVANLLAAMVHEHERAAGAWHAEWRPLRELFIATGSAAAWLRDCLDHLVIHPDRMRANLDQLLAVLQLDKPDLDSAVALVDRALVDRAPVDRAEGART